MQQHLHKTSQVCTGLRPNEINNQTRDSLVLIEYMNFQCDEPGLISKDKPNLQQGITKQELLYPVSESD